jgi:cytochrome c-type biogenesis protein
MDISNVGIGLAFLAGLASFLSPCVFPLVPAYVGYLSGRSAALATDEESSKWIAVSHGIAFVLGFSTIFILFGITFSAIGGLIPLLREWIPKIGGVLVIIFGIHMTGIYRIPFLEYDTRSHTTPDRSRGYIASFTMGVIFSAGWTPCIGPVLGTILTFAMLGGSVLQGFTLLSAYSLGLAIPFLIAATQIGLITTAIQRYGKAMRYIEIGTGILLIILGVLLLSGQFQLISTMVSSFSFGDELVLGRILIVTLVILAIIGLIPAFIASKKGKNFLDWWLFGAGLFPIAFPMSIIMKSAKSSADLSDPT